MAFLNYAGLTRFKDKIQARLDLKKNIQNAVQSPAANGSTSAFIDTISQNTQGVITATKKNVYGTDIAMSSSNSQKIGTAVEAIQDWKPSGNGTTGQILRSKGDGTTEWSNAASASEVATAVDDWMDEHISPNTAIALDDSLTSTTTAAQAAAAGNQIIVADAQPSATTNKLWIKNTPDSEVSVPTEDEFEDLSVKSTLEQEDVPDTTQTVTFDRFGNVETVVHERDNVAIRTDTFEFGTNTITETRTMFSGESLTITINTDTLVTTVAYAA